VDLHPDKVSNVEMGYLYEELLRKFSELSNETAGEWACHARLVGTMALGPRVVQQ
jgi:hypothetical protein